MRSCSIRATRRWPSSHWAAPAARTAISRRIREAVAALGRPLHLAGGLHAGNVAEEVAAVQPWGLDVCSSLRQADRLDAARLAAFFVALPDR